MKSKCLAIQSKAIQQDSLQVNQYYSSSDTSLKSLMQESLITLDIKL